MSEAFRTNLALLCGYHKSIAEVCRRLGLNRQQFNKYLAGKSPPSRRTMRMICDFLGATEAELLSDPAHFEDMIALKRRPLAEGELSKPFSSSTGCTTAARAWENTPVTISGISTLSGTRAG